MSTIYIHFDKKTLIVDSSENLLYPLLGSLLKWNNLRIAFAFSLTQSLTDNNAGFSVTETLPIVGGAPTLNRVAIGLKNRGVELPGEVGCSFAGFSNASDTDGSSLGFLGSTIFLSTRDVYGFNVNLTPTGPGGYPLTTTPTTIPLSAPFSNSGSFYTLPVDQVVSFNGTLAALASPLNDGDTTVDLKADPSVTILPSNWFGVARTDQARPNVSLGRSIGTSFQHTQTGVISQCMTFPPGFVMQGSSNYSTVMVMDFKTTNRGTPSQTIQVGYQVIPFIGDTSTDSLNAKMSAYTASFESAVLPFNTAMPTCLFVRWPFSTTRLRIHSLAAKRF